MKAFFYKLLLLPALLTCLVACSNNQSTPSDNGFSKWIENDGKLKVLSTIEMIDDVVNAIGGDFVSSHTLIGNELDPHSYTLVKGDGEKLEYADLIFYNGLGLEHTPSLRESLEGSPKAIALGEKIISKHPSLVIRIDGQTDPHIWMDVSLWEKTISLIKNELIKKLPERRVTLEKNAAKFSEQLKKLDNVIYTTMQSVPSEKRYLVSCHDAFNYFARRYLVNPGETEWDQRVAAPEGLAPDSQLSTRDIREIIHYLKEHKIDTIFPEANLSKDSIRKIRSSGIELGLKVKIADTALYADSMGPMGSDGDNYPGMLLHNAETIAKYLKEQGNE